MENVLIINLPFLRFYGFFFKKKFDGEGRLVDEFSLFFRGGGC